MKYLMLLIILLPILFFAQIGFELDDKNEFSYLNLGEDTTIVFDNPQTDTVYTIDNVVMDLREGKIALSEHYYEVDEENLIALDVRGNEIEFYNVPIKGIVRVRLVKRGKKFVIVRIRVLKNPE